LFGAAPAALPGTTSGGLFGAAPAASSSGGLFGSTPAASSAAGGLFGSAAPASPAGGLFGAAPSTGASTSNPFGAPSTSTALVPASGGGLFGAAPTTPGAGAVTTQQQPNSLLVQAQQVPQVPSSLDPAREVQEIIDSYNPNHPDYKFRAFFYNVIKDPRLRVKPQNVSERKWRELLEAVGGENNPQHLWPVVYDGFEGLVRRKNEAETEMKAQEEFLAAVISATRQIMQWANTEVEQRMQKVKNKTMEQQHRLIKVFRALNQVQLKNYADANGGAIPPMSAEEIELLNAFKTLSARVNRSAASLPRRAEALAAASRLQRTIAPADEVEISDAEKQRFDAIIERQRAQIEELERKIDEKVAARKAAARISDAARPTSPATSTAHAQRSPTSLLFTESTLRK
jgi:nuclear pore complex protein Nup54